MVQRRATRPTGGEGVHGGGLARAVGVVAYAGARLELRRPGGIRVLLPVGCEAYMYRAHQTALGRDISVAMALPRANTARLVWHKDLSRCGTAARVWPLRAGGMRRRLLKYHQTLLFSVARGRAEGRGGLKMDGAAWLRPISVFVAAS